MEKEEARMGKKEQETVREGRGEFCDAKRKIHKKSSRAPGMWLVY